ncbi:MAG: PLP-dependent cysteine synthase family protein [Pseudomonadales bacterium]|nr:PLP-dependent cysteine synthase family protein [Pseudomonadales bacterium]
MDPWVADAIRRIEADFTRSADTHLIRLVLPGVPDVPLYFKDESTHPSGSLKHRLARSLFLYGLCNGHIREGTAIVEASSGSTAVSEAYFAKILDLPFIAVIPEGTSRRKVEQIEFYGGRCHPVPATELYAAAEALAQELGGHYMDQFTFAERATDWRGNNNIAESIFAQMQREAAPVPDWVVVGAGTGGTSATIGRFIRYRCHPTRLAVADPERSVFTAYWRTRDASLTSRQPSRIEGIGRPRVEPSFVADVVDRMEAVPDAASFAAIRLLEDLLGRRVGPSTGTNFVACARILAEMKAEGRSGSVVTLLCDGGERYGETAYDEGWLRAQQIDVEPWREPLAAFAAGGVLEEPA